MVSLYSKNRIKCSWLRYKSLRLVRDPLVLAPSRRSIAEITWKLIYLYHKAKTYLAEDKCMEQRGHMQNGSFGLLREPSHYNLDVVRDLTRRFLGYRLTRMTR